MVDGVGEVVGVAVGLGEIESRQVVVGEFLPQLQGLGDSVVIHEFDRSLPASGRECNSLLREDLVGWRVVESKFYQADEHRAEKVHLLFATIARRYDLLNDIMSAGLHRRWKRRVVDLAGVGHLSSHGAVSGDAASNKRVLDLCCGTGDIAMAFGRAGADVTG